MSGKKRRTERRKQSSEEETAMKEQEEQEEEVLEAEYKEISEEEAVETGAEATEDADETGWEQEKEELLDKLKRKQAEMENLRRISKREQAEAREYALHDFLSRLLPVLDNLERALESARSDESIPGSHVDGLEMIYKQMLQILEKEGVSSIEAEGAPFDPHCHHAVMEVESEGEEPGHVVEELQKGYWHRERVLRPAMVKVCRE